MNVSKLDGLYEVPWETRNLGTPSFELERESLEAWSGRNLSTEMAKAVGDNYFVQVRIPANAPEQTRIVESLGFRTAELAVNPWIDLRRARLFKDYLEDFSKFIPRGTDAERIRFELVGVSGISDSTRTNIVEGSIEAFSTDRFHTDPHCSADIADARIGMWLAEDLLTDCELKCTNVYLGDDLVGYIVWRKAEFILGGITPDYIGKGFAKLLYLQTMKNVNESSDELSTTISANNIEVLNLYSRLEFSFRNPTYIFHLWGSASNL